MRSIACALALAVVGMPTLGAQDKKTSAKEAPKTISLSGCVVRGEKRPYGFCGGGFTKIRKVVRNARALCRS